MIKTLLLKLSKNVITLFILLLLYNIFSAQEPLKFEVSVDAMLVPLFAVDSAGNPVYDLKQEELKLYVNGILTEINYFNRYKFQYDKEIISGKEIKGVVEPVIKQPDRVIFIIIDSVFNSSAGLRRSKKIASILVTEGNQGDQFIIIENSTACGLKHIAGPSNKKEHLIKSIKKIVPLSSTWMKKLYATRNLTNIEGGVQYQNVASSMRKLDEMDYKNKVKRLSQVLSQLKYAFKTIIKPKIVFLISEGVARGAFEKGFDSEGNLSNEKRFNANLFNNFKDIVKTVNYGGSVLYTINPQNITKSVDRGASGEISLRYMASESGGKYFSGLNTEKIIKRIKKTTSAYYELAFAVNKELGEQLELTVKCSRKGVHAHTLNHSERNRPYNQMKIVQKKLFAFDAITGGSWSRMVGEVNKIKFKKQKSNNNKWTISIDLPEKMKNRDLDIYLIDTDPKHGDVDIDFKTKKSQEKLELDISRKKDKIQYFVIIEPGITSCIYNKIF